VPEKIITYPAEKYNHPDILYVNMRSDYNRYRSDRKKTKEVQA